MADSPQQGTGGGVRTVADAVAGALAARGIEHVWGVATRLGPVPDPVAGAVAAHPSLDLLACAHGESAALAAGAQAQLTGRLAVCSAPAGAPAVQLLNGLHDAASGRTPLLAVCGRLPLTDPTADDAFALDLDALLADVAAFHRTVSSPGQLRTLLEQAVAAALEDGGVAVLSLPHDVAAMPMPAPAVVDITDATLAAARRAAGIAPEELELVVQLLDEAQRVSLLVGAEAAPARQDVLALADRLAAPIVLTLRAKEGLEEGNPFAVGLTGPLGNPAAERALEEADTLLLLGSGFPQRGWHPTGKNVIHVDTRAADIGRRVAVDVPVVADPGPAVRLLAGRVAVRSDRDHLDRIRRAYTEWVAADTAGGGPAAAVAAVDGLAADDAVFTADAGEPAAWLAGVVRMRGRRRLLDVSAPGASANALPQAIGAATVHPDRQVVALTGADGLRTRLGELVTLARLRLRVTVVAVEPGSADDAEALAGVARAVGLRAGVVGADAHGDHGTHAVLGEALGATGPALVVVRPG